MDSHQIKGLMFWREIAAIDLFGRQWTFLKASNSF
jgi:hypothetical protein